MKELTAWLEARLPGLVCEPSGAMRHPYLSLGSHYGAGGRTFFWDAFFSALRFYHDGLATPVRGTLDCYLDHMNADTGQVYRVLSPAGPLVCVEGEQIQPFLCQLAYVADRMSSLAGRAEEILERLTAYLDFWPRQRQSSSGLYRWIDSYESGIDSNLALACYAPFTIAGVDLNSYLVIEYCAISSLADGWGRAEEARAWTERAEALAERVRTHLWSDRWEMFCNLDTKSGELVTQTHEGEGFLLVPWTNFTPLYAGVATQEQAERTIRRYLLDRDELRCRFGFRSLSRRCHYYTEQRISPPANIAMMPRLKTASNWSGAVWTLTNFMLCHGLARYGFREEALAAAREAAEVNWRSIERDGCMFENYHPETGKGLWAENYFSWNILADGLAEEIETGEYALAPLMWGRG